MIQVLGTFVLALILAVEAAAISLYSQCPQHILLGVSPTCNWQQ